MSLIWNEGILNPMVNALLWLYNTLGGNFVLALAVFTFAVRLITLPLNIRQQKSMLKTQEMQPQIKAIQEKHRDNPQKMQEEFAKIGYNPADTLAGCLPLLIQMPILFGLYRAIFFLLGSTPQSLFELSERAYDSVNLAALLPIENSFYWLNLGQPDPLLILPILVFVTMFLQQRLLTPPKKPDDGKKKNQAPDPTAQMNQTMQYTMPIMFGFFSLQFSAGLSIYFVFSNIIGIAQGLYVRQVMAPHREASELKKAASEKMVTMMSDEADEMQVPMPEKKQKPVQSSGSARKPAKRRTSKRKRRS